MSRIGRWIAERPRRPPAEIACRLARDRFWKDERQRLIGTHPDWPDAAYVLDVNEELGHALVLVLSRVPAARRREFADLFYERRRGRAAWLPNDARARLALAAAILLDVIDQADGPEIGNERLLDLLRGAAQRDDLTRTPEPAATEVRTAITRIRIEANVDDAADPSATVAIALAEVLDPSSETVDVKEVLSRSAWAAVETWELPRVLAFLLDVDRLYANE